MNGGATWTNVGSPDTSSPVYTHFDDTSALADGAVVHYRAVLDYAKRGTRTVTSAPRSVTVVQAPVTQAIIHYQRTDGAYANWGLHLFDGNPPGALAARPGDGRVDERDAVRRHGRLWRLPHDPDRGRHQARRLHRAHSRPADTVPTTREPDGDRSFVPLESPEIWLKQGDPTVYTSHAP